MKKITVLVAILVVFFGFGFSANAEAATLSAQQIQTAIDRTDAQGRSLRQILLTDRDDLFVCYDLLIAKGHSIATINGQIISSRNQLASIPVSADNYGHRFFRVFYRP